MVTLAAVVGIGVAVVHADVVGGANVRISFHGWMTPKALPRAELTPVALHMKGRLSTSNGEQPPQLRRVVFAINRHGKVSTRGLSTCPRWKLVAATSAQALTLCRDALVGEGRFNAHIVIPNQAPFPSRGRLLAFNARSHGRRAILAHIYGTQPLPTVQVLTMTYQPPGQGAFGTTMSLRVPKVGEDDWGHVTGFELSLDRRYTYKHRPRSVVSANCPAPSGFDSALFKAAKGTYYLADGRKITRVLTGTCRVQRP